MAALKASLLLTLALALLVIANPATGSVQAQTFPPEERGLMPPTICIDPFGTFDPLVVGGGCYAGLEPGEDAQLLIGRVILESDYARTGARIEAYVDGQPCGATTMQEGNEFRIFQLRISGASEQSGCAEPDDVVEFEIEGVPAAQTFAWSGPKSYPAFGSLTAMEQHAWYWFERIQSDFPAGMMVQARVGGVVCGETEIETDLQGPFLGIPEDIAGFSRLVVPHEKLKPGCGEPRASVSFVADGIEAQTTVAWEPGVQRIDLISFGDANCDFKVSAVDAAVVLQFDAGLVESLACQDLADVDNDGTIDAGDATLILQFDVGLVDSL